MLRSCVTAHFSAGMYRCARRTEVRGRHQRRTRASHRVHHEPVTPQVFLTHLHSDHIADLATFYVGAMFGRTRPWHVWGPSGENATTGTAHSIEGLRQVTINSLFTGFTVPKRHICVGDVRTCTAV